MVRQTMINLALGNDTPFFYSMEDNTKNLLGKGKREGEMFVLTNTSSCGGSMVILINGVLDAVHDVIGDFYALPSSIHEWVIVPDNKKHEVLLLKQMVQEANRTVVSSEEFLSDNVFHFDKENGFQIAA